MQASSPTGMHPLLARLLRKSRASESAPPDAAAWRDLLARLERTYRQADQDRYTLERSLAISSREMFELNEVLRRASQSELARERDRLGAVIHAVGDGLCALDSEGRIVRCNPAAAALFGRAQDELTGALLIGAALAGDAHQRLAREIDAGQPVRCDDDTFVRADGACFPVSYALAPLVRDGVRTGLVLVFRDTSAWKAVERDLTAARAAAESANRAKSTFLATMSHEIRTPMNGVIGMAELLAGTGLSPEQREYVETIKHSGATLLAIINDILDFSKIEADMLELESIEIDLREAVEETLEMLADRAHAKGLEIYARIDPSVPRALRGDPWRLRQVLINLIGNAVKYTERGEVEVDVALRSHDGACAELAIRVRDSGIGVPDEARARLFKAFSQADSSTTRRFGGTGLGLAIARMLVEKMGGEIGHEHAPGGGSVFWCTLKLALTQGAERAAAAPAFGRVALVHAHAASRAALAALLAEHGAEVVELERVDRELTGGVRAIVADLASVVALDPSVAPGAPLIVVGPRSRRAELTPAHGELVAQFVAAPARSAALRNALAALVPHANDAASEIPAPLPQRTGRALRVLVAEDNAVNQRVVERMLARAGHACTLARNGLEAVELALANEFDVILMDCQMPELDGFEATARIRAAATQQSATPIIALTASALSGDEERCRAAGMDGYLSKPLRAADLELALAPLVLRGQTA